MPVALKSSTPRSTEAGSVPVKYGFSVEGSTFAPWTTICWALAGGAAHAAALFPPAELTTGKINGVLQSLLAPANRYWRSLHHFRQPLRWGHANMVDRSLIPATDQAEEVV